MTALGCEVAALGVTAGEGDDPDDDGPSPSTERSRPAGLTRSSTTVPGVDASAGSRPFGSSPFARLSWLPGSRPATEPASGRSLKGLIGPAATLIPTAPT